MQFTMNPYFSKRKTKSMSQNLNHLFGQLLLLPVVFNNCIAISAVFTIYHQIMSAYFMNTLAIFQVDTQVPSFSIVFV